MRWTIAIVIAAPIFAFCSFFETVKPAHMAVWGPSEKVSSFASYVRAHDPALGGFLTNLPNGDARADFDLVRGGALADYPALSGGSGLMMSFTTEQVSVGFGIQSPFASDPPIRGEKVI